MKIKTDGGSVFLQQNWGKNWIKNPLKSNVECDGYQYISPMKNYKIVHFIFFLVVLSFLPVLLPSVSIFRARISLMRSKKTLSTFSRVFADVSTYGTFQSSAWFRAFANWTALRSVRSLLLPTRINGIVSSPLTRRICSRNSCVA